MFEAVREWLRTARGKEKWDVYGKLCSFDGREQIQGKGEMVELVELNRNRKWKDLERVAVKLLYVIVFSRMMNNINNNMLWKRHLSVYAGGNEKPKKT